MTRSKHPLTIDDLWALARLGPPCISPDGTLVCVAVTRFSLQDNSSRTNLWLLSTDGKQERQLSGGHHDSEPQFSPDGKLIAFISRRASPASQTQSNDEPGHLYVIATDGGEARRVTSLNTGVSGIRWFPNGKAIAFISWVWPDVASERAQNKRLAVEQADPVSARVIEHNHYRHWDHWLPRGRQAHLWRVTLHGGPAIDLFAGTGLCLPPQDPSAESYDIAPDGQTIALTKEQRPDARAPAITDLMLLDWRSAQTRNLTGHSGQSEEHPRFSPDGRTIACRSFDYPRLYNAQPRLALVDCASGQIHRLTAAWDQAVNAPLSWSADGKWVYFSSEQGEIQPLYRIATQGGTPSEFARGPAPGGTSTSLAVAANGRLMTFLRSSLDHPPTLMVIDAQGKHQRVIDKFNRALLARVARAKVQSHTIAGFAGEPVQMWVIKPADFDARKRWPLMHVIHGGPHTCFGDAWHWRWNAQLFAAAGYVVVQVNYHGSTGFGQRFVSSINGDWGRRELADIEAATEAMLATGYIDAKRLVATGGSYGGYMVALMNGRSAKGRYQAYVCHAGCYDWVAMMSSDGYDWFGHELGAFPWQDAQRVRKQSPQTDAAQFSTPTLIMHGERDYRVPYDQGLAYYNTLRLREIPARLVFFPDENHWILKPQNSRLWYQEFLAWCGRFAPTAKTRGSSGKKGAKLAR